MSEARSLRQILTANFNDGELRALCHDLGVDYDDLPGEGKSSKAIELIGFLERRDRVSKLVERVRQLRPTILGDDVTHNASREPTSPNLSSDLISDIKNSGIEGLWPRRREWQYDPANGMQMWLKRVCQANRVEIMSNTLWNFGMRDRKFRRDLFANIARGALVRILVYDPDSDVLRLKAGDEKDAPGEMQTEIKSTLLRLVQGWAQLEELARRNLQVGLTHKSLHFVQLIRADELILVTSYLSGTTGGESPTMQLRGPGSAYFDIYAEQFSIMWKRCRLLNNDDYHRMLKEFSDVPRPPTEA
jgi:hypothetical protein